jgi:hypothetical protein
VVTVDLGPITLDALGGQVSVDIPQATVNPFASGAVGPLLCSLVSASAADQHLDCDGACPGEFDQRNPDLIAPLRARGFVRDRRRKVSSNEPENSTRCC